MIFQNEEFRGINVNIYYLQKGRTLVQTFGSNIRPVRPFHRH